jgi:hypothetical protein
MTDMDKACIDHSFQGSPLAAPVTNGCQVSIRFTSGLDRLELDEMSDTVQGKPHLAAGEWAGAPTVSSIQSRSKLRALQSLRRRGHRRSQRGSRFLPLKRTPCVPMWPEKRTRESVPGVCSGSPKALECAELAPAFGPAKSNTPRYEDCYPGLNRAGFW